MPWTCEGFVECSSYTGHLLNATKLPLPGQEEGAEKEEQKKRPLKSRRCAVMVAFWSSTDGNSSPPP